MGRLKERILAEITLTKDEEIALLRQQRTRLVERLILARRQLAVIERQSIWETTQ